MRTFLLVLAVLEVGCGRVVVDEVEPGVPDTVDPGAEVKVVDTAPKAPRPGWYDVPADPAGPSLGYVQPQLLDGSLLHGTFSFQPSAPQGLYELVVVWANGGGEQVVGVTTRESSAFRGRLTPPAGTLTPSSCPRGRKASGVVFVTYRSGGRDTGSEVVGTSNPRLAQLGSWSWEVTYDECASGNRYLPPIALLREPRLELARCMARGGRCADSDAVRLRSASLEDDGDAVRLDPDFVFFDEGAAITLDINGVRVSMDRAGRYPRSAFRPGRNRVTWRMGRRTPWEATVVLPSAPLTPVVPGALRLNDTFTVRWTDSGWATTTRVDLFPVDAPWTRAVYPSFEAVTSPLTATFPGFPDGRGGVVTGTRASVRLTTRRDDDGFSVSQTEGFEAPITP
jgi:hypothetical protein